MDRDPELRMIGFYVLRGHDHEKLLRLSEVEKLAYYTWMQQHYEEEAEQVKRLFGSK